jgi:MFS family permease
MIARERPKAATTLAILCLFMLLHQTDKFLVAPLTTPIMETFGIAEDLMGLTATAAVVVGILFLPLWGYLGDKMSRPFVIGIASSIWGVTTSASAIAPSYGHFLAARASTGIDDDAYPAVRSLVSDYVAPSKRSVVFGLLSATAPVGYLLAVVLALALRYSLGWRGLYLVTGVAGLILAIVVFARLKEVRRGLSDIEALEEENSGGSRFPNELPSPGSESFEFSWSEVRKLARRPTFLILVAQGFFGVFPWNVIAFWFFRYLETERSLKAGQIFVVMAAAILAMTAGNVAGGWMGDTAATRLAVGRIAVSMTAVLLGAVLLWVTLSIPTGNTAAFAFMTALTAFVIPMAGPNVQATLMEISPPEIRSTASAVQSFMEGSGASLAPFLAGVVAVRSSLEFAIGSVSVVAWLICGVLFGLALLTVSRDREATRSLLRSRLA